MKDDNELEKLELEIDASDYEYLVALAKELNLSISSVTRRIMEEYIYLKKNHKIDRDFRAWVEDLYEETMTKKAEVNTYRKRSRISLILGRK